MILNGHFQNAYVTHDLEAAMALMSDRFGVGDYLRFDPEMVLTTPEGEREASVRVALAWVGGLQIELIQPVSGHVDAYRAVLPADPGDPSPRFHHIALRRDDLPAMRAEMAALGLPLAWEGSVPGLVFTYLDARPVLGHFLEYIWADEAGWKMNGWPEGRSAA